MLSFYWGRETTESHFLFNFFFEKVKKRYTCSADAMGTPIQTGSAFGRGQHGCLGDRRAARREGAATGTNQERGDKRNKWMLATVTWVEASWVGSLTGPCLKKSTSFGCGRGAKSHPPPRLETRVYLQNY